MEFEHSEDDLSPHYQDGIGCDSSVWQRTAKISSNCAEHCCCRRHDLLSRGPARYEQKFLSDCKTLGMSDRSVRRIAKMDLELSAFRRMPAQVLSDAVKLKRLERCRALLRRLTVNKVKQVFFTDEKNFYLNPPVSKSVSYFINFHSSWKFCLHLRCCNRDIHAC